MISLLSLWLPILLSAVIVFVISSIIHMLLPYHRSDWKGMEKQDEVQDALRPFKVPPGDYFLPHCASAKDRESPESKEKFEKGPVMLITVLKNGMPGMASSLVLWFLYSIVVSFFAAYIASRALGAGAHQYLSVFRFVGAAAFGGYSLALLQGSIWYKRSWSATLKSMFDGLIYAAFTAGTFGWLWPA
jgi:hypothetical protein